MNHAVNSHLERESRWWRKHSTLADVHRMWSTSDIDTHEESQRQTLSVGAAKKMMKDAVKIETLKNWNKR